MLRSLVGSEMCIRDRYGECLYTGMADRVQYTWEGDGPLGLGIAADVDGIVVESVVDNEVARTVAPGMFVLAVAGHLIEQGQEIDHVIELIRSSKRPLTIEFEERLWYDDDSIHLSDVEHEAGVATNLSLIHI
eukprot:TRINITY_DN28872_c0_g1_i2.p1 TRINITY_DN28872_c0_g1~~TRINITY_DN28872_c0_g1_i2.p1  ORF type:complete len:133 (+),score=48.38 TRINITY_DN28872_c0_g1_i2:131-529(+)